MKIYIEDKEEEISLESAVNQWLEDRSPVIAYFDNEGAYILHEVGQNFCFRPVNGVDENNYKRRSPRQVIKDAVASGEDVRFFETFAQLVEEVKKQDYIW